MALDELRLVVAFVLGLVEAYVDVTQECLVHLRFAEMALLSLGRDMVRCLGRLRTSNAECSGCHPEDAVELVVSLARL